MKDPFMPGGARPVKASLSDIKVVCIAWGWLLGFAFLTAVRASFQTLKIWRRVGHATAYVYMIWVQLIACVALGTVCWLCMNGIIWESFAFFLVGVTLKSIIVQLTVQIVANRISILITDPQRKRYLRWGPFGLVLALNIGVYCIWIPAHLRISTTFVDINHYYSRCEKVIYTLADASLNVYFCYLVKSRLISAGMAKYTRLYRFNICIIVVNLSMDVLLIGSMSLPNELVYVQLYPVVYMAKLNIEMSMAETISKVARSSNEATGRGAARKGDDLCSTSEHGYHSSVDSGMMLAPAKLDVGPRVPVNTASRASIVGRSPQRHFDRQASVYNSLYHAWVSGGMSSQAHLGTRGSRQKQGDRGPEFEVGNGPTLAVDGAKEQQNVITKDTVVHVRTESVRNVPTPTRGDVDR